MVAYTPAQKKAYALKMAKSAKPARVPRAKPRKAYVPRNTKMPSGIMKNGGNLGGQIGQAIGSSAQSLFSRFLGLGEYDMAANSLVATSAPQVPFMHSSKDSTVLRHREYITDINSVVGNMVISTLEINAGLDTAFPWLASIAQQFESYRFKGLVFEFKSIAGDQTTIQNQGVLAVACDYNPTSAIWVNKQQIENAQYSCSGKPSENIFAPIECAPNLQQVSEYYVRGNPLLAGQSSNLYDLGLLTWGIGGCPVANVPCWELWASYEVELMSPQSTGTIGTYLDSAHFSFGSAVTDALPLNGVVKKFDNIGLTIVGNVITFPVGSQGNYLMNFDWIGTTRAGATNPGLTLVNCQFLNVIANNAISLIANNGTTTSVLVANQYLSIINPLLVSTVTLGAGILPLPITSGDLHISQLAQGTV